MGEHQEEIQVTQMISQKLIEVAGEAHSTCFEDMVPNPYQYFKDVFTKESFDKLPDQKKWDHTIELIPNAQIFSNKVYPCPQLNRSSWMTSSKRTSKADAYVPPTRPWHLWSSS